MIVRRLCALALVGALASCGGDEGARGEVHVADARIALSPTNPDVAFVYFTATASGGDAVLVGADVDGSVARFATIAKPTSGSAGGHEGHLDGDGAPDHEHEARIELPNDARIVFEPGGNRIALTGLAAPLADGATVTVVLRLDGGTTVTVDAKVDV